MNVSEIKDTGLKLITPQVFRDERGFFLERFRTSWLEEQGISTEYLQENRSRSLPGVVRGLHYQFSPAQGKLVGAIRGRILDVVVDLRLGSPTFGQHFNFELSEESGQMLWIPRGFAHGFCVLGNEPADVLYQATAPYSPKTEGGIRWNDPDLGISWPVQNAIVSKKDQALPTFADFKKNPVQNWD
jgi:dTDP-4-dehydrorhamnose 3,5-epimerase